MNLQAITPLLVRVVAFLGCFVLISGLIGPHIITSGILYRDYFAVYGGLGKALLFASIAFILLVRAKPLPPLQPWRPQQLAWLAVAALASGGAWLCVDRLIQSGHQLPVVLATHALLLTAVIASLTVCFGIANLLTIGRYYKQQLLYALLAGGVFFGLLTAFYASWKFCASLVLHGVRWLLEMGGLTVGFIPPHSLLLDKFGITIAQTCSGVESMALFTGLYIVIALVDKDRLNLRRLLLIFPIALAGMFAFNILRVYTLIVGGYYINPDIAFVLFHTYAGMIFFIIYAALFWKVSYKWMLHKT